MDSLIITLRNNPPTPKPLDMSETDNNMNKKLKDSNEEIYGQMVQSTSHNAQLSLKEISTTNLEPKKK